MDVTAYGKGHIGAFTVLMANILEPELFTASCIFVLAQLYLRMATTTPMFL